MLRCRAQDEAASGDSSAPWNIGSYYTKQKERALDDVGQSVELPDNTEEPVGWNADSKLRLADQVSDGKCAAQAPRFPLNSQCTQRPCVGAKAAATCPACTATQIVSRDAVQSEHAVAQRVQLLFSLLPDLGDHIASLQPAELVELSMDLTDVAEKLLLLRDALPTANLSRVLAGNCGLLRLSWEQLRSNLQQVRD